MRYFIIFYSFYTSNNTGVGTASVQTINFLNHNETVQFIAEKSNMKPKQICITGLIEVTREEYEQWNK